MARRENIITTDDFDGTEGATTVRFGLDGTSYDVDLSLANEAELREFLAHYVSAGRRVTATTGRRYTHVDVDVDTRAVRAWAAGNGIEVSPRGRISSEVIAQYRAAGH